MPLDHKKSAPIMVDTSSKRLKIGPDVGSIEVPTVRWSDIPYLLVTDIFSHLFTIQQTKYRRVSSDWNIRLKVELARSTVLSLRRPDLTFWKAIMHPPLHSRVTRLSIRSRNVNLVTDRTRRLIIDFANTDCQSATFVTDVSCLIGKDEQPLADVGRYHPQISQVALYRILIPYIFPVGRGLENFLNEIGWRSMPSVCPTAVVTICEFGLRIEKSDCWMFTDAEWTDMRSWKMYWPKTTFKFDTADFTVFGRERSLGYWPYPADQLTWLISSLDLLPAKDPILRFLTYEELRTHLDYTSPTFLTLRGSAQSRYVLAFIARYMVTFRQHLNLPPPPHPLLWND